MANLNWHKPDDIWPSLMGLYLDSIAHEGIYIIWYEGAENTCICIGQGNIATKLKEHRNDDKIIKYSVQGPLRVTWANANPLMRDGIERFLKEKYLPLEHDSLPRDNPHEVNLPF